MISVQNHHDALGSRSVMSRRAGMLAARAVGSLFGEVVLSIGGISPDPEPVCKRTKTDGYYFVHTKIRVLIGHLSSRVGCPAPSRIR